MVAGLDYSDSSAFERDSLARKTCDLMCVYGSICLLVYGVKSRLSGMQDYSNILLMFALFSTVAYFLFRITGDWPRHRALVTSGLSALYLYLLASGGEQDTGLFWCYIYPIVIFSIVGTQRGRWILSCMIVLSVCILYAPELVWATHDYALNIKHRFIGSITLVSVLAYYMEKARLVAQQDSDIAKARLALLACSDELTGTFNRRGIESKIQDELHRVVRNKTEMSIVLCDVDWFKRINDRYGHDVGDVALQHIARILGDTVRVTDMVGRWGGEEFLIMLPNTSLHKGYQLIERVREKIASEPIVVGEHTLNLSISCGICSTQFLSRFGDLIKAADISLYEAKAQGRNCTRPELNVG